MPTIEIISPTQVLVDGAMRGGVSDLANQKRDPALAAAVKAAAATWKAARLTEAETKDARAANFTAAKVAAKTPVVAAQFEREAEGLGKQAERERATAAELDAQLAKK